VTRIIRGAGMNIARALGDKFLKEEESAFSSEPHVSSVFRLSEDGSGLVVIARYVNLVHWTTSLYCSNHCGRIY
jgi:hypothetical protein